MGSYRLPSLRPKTQHLSPNLRSLPRPKLSSDTECRGYNRRVPQTGSESDASHKHHHRHAVYASETMGLLLIAFVLLVMTVVRYWQSIHWSLH